MSKKVFKAATARNKVQAVFSRFKRVNGKLTGTPLYDIYGPDWMKRQ